MSFTIAVKCPACHAGHLVSCSTTGLAKELSPDPFCFECTRCQTKLDAHLPTNARENSVRVMREHSPAGNGKARPQ